MRQFGKRHEASSLVRILFEDWDLCGRLPARYLAGYEFAEIADLLPGDEASLNGFEQVRLFIHDGLLAAAVYHKAREQGLRTEIPADWFLQDIRD
jgi:hypothetical protein